MMPMRYIFPRALMAPPGHPDFFTRTRVVAPGTVRVTGKAYSGPSSLRQVEFSSDGGKSWKNAVLGEKNGLFGWATWHFDWEASEGTCVLSCRLTNADGHTQDEASDEQFNAFAMGCTQPQLVYVRVAAVEAGDSISLDAEAQCAKSAGHGPLPEDLKNALCRSTGSQ